GRDGRRFDFALPGEKCRRPEGRIDIARQRPAHGRWHTVYRSPRLLRGLELQAIQGNVVAEGHCSGLNMRSSSQMSCCTLTGSMPAILSNSFWALASFCPSTPL